jgi:hypothetical protein
MEKRDKAAVLDWFKAHKGKNIEIKWRGTLVRLRGRTTGVESLDACSAEYQESTIDAGHEDVQIGLSFHDTALGVHLGVQGQGGTEASVSMPISIPYDQLELSIPKKKEQGKKPSGEQSEEPEFSPYELLH